MAKGSLVFEVDRPAEEVFAYVADLENAPDWVPDLVSVNKVTEGEIRVGTRYTEVVKMGGKTGDATLEVTEYDPPRKFAHKGQGGPATFTADFTFEETPKGTRVTHDYTVKLSGLMKMMEPMMAGWVRRNSEASVEALRRTLESGDHSDS